MATLSDDTQARILHISTTPMTRVHQDGLAALGVVVESIHPRDIGGIWLDDAIADEAIDRVTNAPVCVLDDGIGLRLATRILVLRASVGGQTITTLPSVRLVSEGMLPEGDRTRGLGARCEFVLRDGLSGRLRRFAPANIAPPVRIDLRSDATRPPHPLPYAINPDAYPHHMLHPRPDEVPMDMTFQGGRTHMRELLAPGALARWPEITGSSALSLLIPHLASEELELLGGPEARGWWLRLADEMDDDRGGVHYLFWHALGRDGGHATLAALPDSLLPMYNRAAAQWPLEIEQAAKRMPFELASAAESDRIDLIGGTLRAVGMWDVVPCEDPLAPDADPNLFRPTLTTFRVARRYRSAPEVVLGSHARWGGRPYQEALAQKALSDFVTEHAPASPAEVEGWARVLLTLPGGRMRKAVRDGMYGWPRIELEIANLLGEDRLISACLPCFDKEGDVIDELANQIANPGTLSSMLARTRARPTPAVARRRPA